MRHPLDTAFAKLEYAQEHIETLRNALLAFLHSKPYRLVSTKSNNAEEIWSIAVDPIPHKIECIAADAVHNIRTPLDKMIAAGFPHKCTHTVHASLQKLFFPSGNDKTSFEHNLVKLRSHVTAPVIEFLRSAEPYASGKGNIFRAINRLDNSDKHHALLEPIKFAFSSASFGEIIVREGFLLRIGSPRGKHMVPVPDARPGAWHMYQPVDHLKPITKAHPYLLNGIGLEFTSPYDDMEVFTTTPGAQPYIEIAPNLNLAFNNISDFAGIPVLEALDMMRTATSSLLEEYKKTFF